MGSKYSSTSVTSYNASPPSDDGSTASTNQVKWATIKTKLSDPLNTFASNINSALVTAFDYSMRSVTSADSTVAGDHMRTLEVPSSVTTTFTISLADAATMTNGYIVRVRNSSAVDITVGRASAGDTIDGTAGNVTLPAKSTAIYAVNASANGYDTISYSGTLNASKVQGTWTAASTWTLPALTLGGTVTLNGQSFSGTCANGGTFTTIDINGGTIDGVTIGGSSAAAATVTTLTASGAVKASGGVIASGAISFTPAANIGYMDSSGTGTINFRSLGPDTSTYGSFSWASAYSNNGSGSTLMTLSPTGLAVTGTLSATSNVTASVGSASQIAFTSANSAGSFEHGVFGTGEGYLAVTTNDPLLFYTNNTRQMTLDTSGNLLLNTTSTATTAAGCLHMGNATAPTGSITGGVLYVEGGALKFRGSSGTVTTIAVA